MTPHIDNGYPLYSYFNPIRSHPFWFFLFRLKFDTTPLALFGTSTFETFYSGREPALKAIGIAELDPCLLCRARDIVSLLKYFSMMYHQTLSKMDLAKVQQAASIISKDISKHYTIHELAELVLVNRKKLLESFKQVYGMGPFEYLTDLRLEKSKTMLMENASLKRISIAIGFSGDSSENNFIRFFKRKTGCTPQAWKQMQRPQTA